MTPSYPDFIGNGSRVNTRVHAKYVRQLLPALSSAQDLPEIRRHPTGMLRKGWRLKFMGQG